jgi:hypothetical protein
MPRTNPEARCPCCLKTLDGATSAGERKTPLPGDFSVCVYCTSILQFNTDLTLRQITAETLAAIPPSLREQLERIRFAIIRRP